MVGDSRVLRWATAISANLRNDKRSSTATLRNSIQHLINVHSPSGSSLSGGTDPIADSQMRENTNE